MVSRRVIFDIVLEDISNKDLEAFETHLRMRFFGRFGRCRR